MNLQTDPSLHPNIHSYRQDLKKKKTQLGKPRPATKHKKSYSYPKNFKS